MADLRVESDAYRELEYRWWPAGHGVCPHCESRLCTPITPSNGVSRRTNAGSESPRRVWKCAQCRKQFSVLTGTPLERSKVPVSKWVLAIDIYRAQPTVSARRLADAIGVHSETAWQMLKRLALLPSGRRFA